MKRLLNRYFLIVFLGTALGAGYLISNRTSEIEDDVLVVKHICLDSKEFSDYIKDQGFSLLFVAQPHIIESTNPIIKMIFINVNNGILTVISSGSKVCLIDKFPDNLTTAPKTFDFRKIFPPIPETQDN